VTKKVLKKSKRKNAQKRGGRTPALSENGILSGRAVQPCHEKSNGETLREKHKKKKERIKGIKVRTANEENDGGAMRNKHIN